jgi:hypothetical protein
MRRFSLAVATLMFLSLPIWASDATKTHRDTIRKPCRSDCGAATVNNFDSSSFRTSSVIHDADRRNSENGRLRFTDKEVGQRNFHDNRRPDRANAVAMPEGSSWDMLLISSVILGAAVWRRRLRSARV